MKVKKWEKMQETYDFPFGGWMLHSLDASRRHAGSAGGVVTELARYLLDNGIVGTVLGFRYQLKSTSFEPRWVYSAEEVNQVGSIYHDVNIISFLRDHVAEISGPLMMTVLPCQVSAVRAICKRARIPVFIVSLVCSGQLGFDATNDLFKRVSAGRKVVRHRYRGGGWPSGVRISYEDGGETFLDNNHSVWTQLFHSLRFNLPRCLTCKNTFGVHADISVGDPWLTRYIEYEKEGVSMCMPHNQQAVAILDDMLQSEIIGLYEIIPAEEVLASQKGTIEKKAIYKAYPSLIKGLHRFYRHPLYIHFVYKRNIRKHIRLHNITMNILRRL